MAIEEGKGTQSFQIDSEIYFPIMKKFLKINWKYV